MPEDRKTPDNVSRSEEWSASPRPKGRSGSMKSLAQAEDLMQIAFVLPCGMLLGWAAGYGVDKLLHTHWATITGLILGIVLGMVSVIRTATAAMKRPGTEKSDAGKTGSGGSRSDKSGSGKQG